MKQATTLALLGCTAAVVADLWSLAITGMNVPSIVAFQYLIPGVAHLFFHVTLLLFFLKLKNSQSQAA